MATPTPAGVPVAMTSPGSRVKAVLRCSTMAKQSKIGELEDVVVTQAEIMGEAIAILSAEARDVDDELRPAAKARRSRGVSRN